MPYYHVRIKYTIPGTVKRLRFFLKDLPERVVRTKITEPFNDRVSFKVNNETFEGDYVDDVAIFKSEQKFDTLLHEVRGKYEPNAELNDVWTYMMEGKLAENVTAMFIKPRFKGAKKIKSTERISKNVFIVHGKDLKPMRELKTMLEEFGLNIVVLHEQPSGSRTIIEKLEKYSQGIGFVFVLLTPDDVLVPTTPFPVVDEKQGTVRPLYIYDTKPIFRARQNVILEFGFFIAKTGRNKVCCLYRENTELPYDMPSDMHGIVYIPFKESVREVKEMIIKELEVAGYKNLYPPPSPPPY